MARSVEAITDQLYEDCPDGKRYPDIPDGQIARELFEAGDPIGNMLRQTLSPPLMRFFARVERSLTSDPAFRQEVRRAFMAPPAYLMPYTSRMEFLEREMPEGTDFFQYVAEHDSSIPGHHFTTSRDQTHHDYHFPVDPRASDALDPDLLKLHEAAHSAQHRDGFCIAGRQVKRRLYDEKLKPKELNVVERLMVEHCLTYYYPVYRVLPTFSDFSLTGDIWMPLADADDIEDLEFTDTTVRSTALLLQLIAQDRQFAAELQEILQDERTAAHIRRYTQRGNDKIRDRNIGFLQQAIIKTVEEGIGSSILPAIAELRRADDGGNRISMEEVVAGKKVPRLVTLSPLSYIGKVNIRGRGLPTVLEKDSQEKWGFTEDARLSLRAMRTFMRRQFHYKKLRAGTRIQVGGRCPFVLEGAGLPTDAISAATELIFLLSAYANPQPEAAKHGNNLKHYFQQKPPGPFYIPGHAPDLSSLLESTEKTAKAEGVRYQRLGLEMARAALAKGR